jgi:RNA polymerase sigma factor (sigma-70 family)
MAGEVHHGGVNRDEDQYAAERDTLKRNLDRYLLSGDEEAMEVIVDRTRPALLRVARGIGAPQDAEDAVQSAYFSLLRKQGQRLDIPVLPWLKTAVIRIAYRQKAKQQKQHDIARRLSRPLETATPLEQIVSASEITRVRREIARLPATYRDPVVLRYLDGLSTAEAAELLGLPEATVRTRLHRARGLLKGRLPVPVRYGFVAIPWLLTDAANAAKTALVQLATGTSVPAPVAAMAIFGAATLGVLTPTILPDARGQQRAGETVVEENASLKKEGDDLRAEIDRLAQRRERASRRRQDAAKMLAAVRGELRALEGVVAGTPAAVGPEGAPLIRAPGLENALATVDWNVLGTTLSELVPLLAEIGRGVSVGREPDPDTRGRFQELNGLVLQLTARFGREIEETDISHVVLMPGYMANVMASMLRASGLPLSEAQSARLASEVATATAKDRPTATTVGDISGLEQRGLLWQRRQEFLDAAFAILGEAQIDTLSPPVLHDRMGVDIVSTMHVWRPVLNIVPFQDQDDLSMGIVDLLARQLDLPSSDRDAVRDVVDEWIDTLPASLLEGMDDPMSQALWVPLTRVEEMVPHTTCLHRTLASRLSLEERRLQKLRGISGPIYPFKRRVPDE